MWGAQATSAFGTRIGREAIALSAVMLLGSGPLDLAWLNLAMSLPYLIFGLAAGVLIDRVRRRPLLIATDLIGVNRGEVIRLWIFLACFFQIPAAYVCARLESRVALGLVLGTTLLQAALGTSMIGFILPG